VIYRALGRTHLEVSALAFGAGPVAALMTGGDRDVQRATIARAVEQGINWFDTAATYGEGRSESALGAALGELDPGEKVQVATKVRLPEELHGPLRDSVREAVHASLKRLGRRRITLLQLHNAVTRQRGDEPTSLCPAEVLSPGGVLEAMADLKQTGDVAHLGLTGIGHPTALSEVIASEQFETVQTPYSLLNPSAGRVMSERFTEADYGDILSACARQSKGTFAIRVFAGGALANQPASQHTRKTRFFTLDLYHRDLQRAATLREWLASYEIEPTDAAVRFAVFHPHLTAAIVGLARPVEVDHAVASVARGPLPPAVEAALERWFDGGLTSFDEETRST